MTVGGSQGLTRVLVVDDHSTFAEMLATVLNREPDLESVGHAKSGPVAVAMYEDLRPDLVTMDLELSGSAGGGLEATRAILALDPHARVVVLTAHATATFVGRAMDAGACGFVAKDGNLAQMLHALRAVRSGQVQVYPGLMSELLALQREESVMLTIRERDVLRLMGHGMDVHSIAKELGVSVHTCRDHVKQVLAKLGAHSQLEAVVIAVRRGILEMERS